MMQQSLRASDVNSVAADDERYCIGYSSELFDVLDSFGFRRGAAVLDAGCGTGRSAGPLVARGVTVTGVDPSLPMLASAERLVPGAKFVAGQVEALPFGSNVFDSALSAQAFHFFDADTAFAELIRVVKPGGSIGVWWKILGADDPIREARVRAARSAGAEAPADPLRGGFAPFYRAPFAHRTLRVLPFVARFALEDWLGFERSQFSSPASQGDRRDAYIAALRTQLIEKYGSADARLDVRYSQFLYVGECPK